MALAFIRRDLTILTSYRLAMLMRVGGMILGVASFYFVGQLIGPSASSQLAEYGGDYFAFALVGVAFVGFQAVGLGSFASTLSTSQAQGTLETMLVTPTSLSSIVLSSAAWDFLFTAINVLLYLAVGGLIFGVDLTQANVVSALVVLTLTVLVFSGIGVISASVVMVLKRGDPVAWLFGSVSSLLGGTLFPTTLLPDWLERLAHLLPVYYGLHAMRMAVLQGASLVDIRADVIALSIFAVTVLPISLLAFRAAVRLAKTDGTLGTY